MRYTLEEIYVLVGREDKTVGLTFSYDSEAFRLFGPFLTVVFLYTQKEREELDELVLNTPFSKSGYLKARNLVDKLTKEQEDHLKTKGIHSEDIVEIFYFRAPEKNTFHSTEKRTIHTIEIPFRSLPKGRDYDWMYGFKKQQIAEGIGLCPSERYMYLAGKLYYEPDTLTEGEKKEAFVEGTKTLKAEIEWEFLGIKYMRQEIEEAEKKRLAEMLAAEESAKQDLLDKYLQQAGSSLKKLAKDNIDQAVELYRKVMAFKERRLNVIGKVPIYIDLDGFLHIYMRHVEEFKVTDHFEDKDNFQWEEEDVYGVMANVVKDVDEEIQDFFYKNTGKRYSRYGTQSIYYQGDYYTFHVDANGRVATFHKNKKVHKQK
jgi:hypothetical protein